MKIKHVASGSQQRAKKTPRRNRRRQRKMLKSLPKDSSYESFLRNLKNSPPTSPSPSQVRRNRKYVRKLKAQEDQKMLQQSILYTAGSNKSFEDELDEYSSKRLSMDQPSTSKEAQASYKSPIKSPNSVISIPDDDSEIEEGEIVEREVSQCVDLIEESFNVLKKSRKITDLSPVKPLFFEDKRADDNQKELPPPIYNTIGTPSNANKSDDVILIESPQKSSINTSNTDDSIIFVSEEPTMPKPLQKPKVLSSPALNELMKLSGVRLTPLPKDRNPKRRERVQNYFNKKKMEYARKEVEKTIQGNAKDTQKPTTSTASVAAAAGPSGSSPTSTAKKKRIILIDGSNVAITHAKSKLGRDYDDKSPGAFSVEGLSIALKHFQNMGFQVKAVIPEYRLKEKKSSNARLLHELEDEGLLIPTPSKAYDDRILLESASRLNAAVVSNDYFRDFKSNENFAELLNKRHIRYNWVFDEFVLTEDSYGRNGPLLKDILYINT